MGLCRCTACKLAAHCPKLSLAALFSTYHGWWRVFEVSKEYKAQVSLIRATNTDDA